MKTVNTVRGPISTAELGKTLMHEHIMSSSAGIPENYPDLYGEKPMRQTLADIADMKAHGISTVVDATPFDLGRDVLFMKKAAEETDFNFIACGGFFKEPDPMLGTFTKYDFAKAFIREINEGIGSTGIKPGILKTAMDMEGPTAGRELIHRAIAIASRETGCPVMLHSCPINEAGKHQVRFLKEEGADLSRVKIDHCLEKGDMSYIQWLYDQGVWLGVDRFPRVCVEKEFVTFPSIDERCETVMKMLDAGMGDRMLFGHDLMCASTYFDNMADPDDQYYIDHMSPERFHFIQGYVFNKLVELGASREKLENMLIENPRRFFEQ